jgi:hypothetical protein
MRSMFVSWIVFNRSPNRHRSRASNFPSAIQFWFSGEDIFVLRIGWICWRYFFRLVLVAGGTLEEDKDADSQPNNDDNAANGNAYNCTYRDMMVSCFIA